MERRRTSKRAAPAPKVVAVLAGLLERAAKRGDADADAGGAGPGSGSGSGSSAGAAAFRGRAGKRPEIGVRRYAERIYRYAGCSPACFVVAYAYLDRLARRQGAGEGDAAAGVAVAVAVDVDSYSVHRLLITSVMVAAKFMDDIHYNNAYFARVGGVEVSEMNGLELEFLFALRFRLNVTPAEFASYCAALEGEMTTTTAVEVAPPLFAGYGRLSPEEVESQDQQPPQKDAVVARVTFTAAQRVAEITQ